MKRHLFFAVLVAVIFSCTSLYAGQDHLDHFYVGAGGSYAVEDFGNSPDFDNSWGVNAKIGYHTHPLLDIESKMGSSLLLTLINFEQGSTVDLTPFPA